jgi:Tol biopolymer transport system component
VPTGVAWVKGSLVFSVAGQGVHLYRQRISEATFQPVSAPERLTAGTETAWLPTAAAGHLAYFSGRADGNLWSVALDATSGVASGPQRRMTRGTLPLGYLTLTRDCRTLAYFSYRLGPGDVFLRDLETGSEKPLAQGPDAAKGYPAISPTGNLLAIGMRMSGAGRALRPISILDLREGTWRSLGEDCGGRPREWVDERVLIIERFARLNSIAIIDAETGEQFDLLQSSERSVSNPRLSPDRRWIAFDASRPGAQASVFVSPFEQQPIAESAWIEVDRSASHPFWSADGRFLYYTQIGTNPSVRSAVRGRHFASPSGLAPGQSIEVYRSTEMLMPAYLPGTAPIATPDQIILVLGDFRGDVWIMDLDP